MKFALATYSTFAGTVDALAADGATSAWMLLVPAGSFEARDGRKFVSGSQAEMQAIVARTRQYHGTTDIVVDYDHQSVFGAKDGVGGTARAAGWIKQLEVRGDGIWGRIEWTPAALEAIRAGEYRYLSPVIPHRKDGRIIIILNAALTNTPALDLTAAAASSQLSNLNLSDEGNDMEKILKALGLAEGSGEDAVLSAINGLLTNSTAIAAAVGLQADAKHGDILAAVNTALSDRAAIATAAGKTASDKTDDIVDAVRSALKAGNPDPAKYVPISVVTELRDELKEVKDATLSEKAENAVSAAIKDGRVTPGQKEWALSYAKSDLAGFEGYIKGAPVLTASQMTVTKREDNGRVPLDDAQRAVCSALGLSEEEYRKQLAADEAAEENS